MIFEDDHHCFVCGAENPAGLRLNFSAVDGRVSAEFILPKHFQGYKDIVHGGIMTTLLDEAMIKAAFDLELRAITAEITVRFKNPLFTGEKAVVEGEVLKKDKRLIEAKALIKDGAGRTVAEARGKLLVR